MRPDSLDSYGQLSTATETFVLAMSSKRSFARVSLPGNTSCGMPNQAPQLLGSGPTLGFMPSVISSR